jgi:hypothetical protein
MEFEIPYFGYTFVFGARNEQSLKALLIVGLLLAGLSFVTFLVFAFKDARKWRSAAIRTTQSCLVIVLCIALYSAYLFGINSILLFLITGGVLLLLVHQYRLDKEREAYPFAMYAILKYFEAGQEFLGRIKGDPAIPSSPNEAGYEQLTLRQHFFPYLKSLDKDWPAYAIFLRSFATEGEGALIWREASRAELIVQKELKECFGDRLPFIAVGTGDVMRGASRIMLWDTLSKHWVMHVTSLLVGAELIVVSPFFSKGTVKEFKIVLDNFPEKAVFFAPEKQGWLGSEGDGIDRDVLRRILEVSEREVPKIEGGEALIWRYAKDGSLLQFSSLREAFASIPMEFREVKDSEYYLSEIGKLLEEKGK